MKLLKYAISSVLCNLWRLARIFPNNDPIMAFMLPFSRQDKWLSAMAFAFTTIFVFDFFTSGIGVWTWVTAITYAAIGLFAHFYLSKRQKVTVKTYLGTGVAGVLAYDFVTGVLFGPAMFGVPIEAAFFGQIPFTLMHVLSAGAYILVLTPFLDRHVAGSQLLEDENAINAVKILLKKQTKYGVEL